MTGTGSRSIAWNICDAAVASRTFSSSEYAAVFASQDASAPAQNTLPAPAITTTRTPAGSDDSRLAHEESSATISALNALRTSGRLSVRCSTGPSRRERRNLYSIAALHSENAESRLGNRRVVRRRQPQREHRTRIHRIDHAIVPKPGGRVVRRSFVLVLRQNRGAN